MRASSGPLVSPSASLEEAYLLQKLVRGLGAADVDHRLRDADFSDQDEAPLFPSLESSIAEIETRDAVLLVGAWPRKEHPIVNHRLRKASLAGAQIMALNPADYDFNFRVGRRIVASPRDMVDALARVVAALPCVPALAGAARDVVDKAAVCAESAAVAAALHAAKRSAVLLGPAVAAHPEGALLRALAAGLASSAEASLGLLTDGANAAGAWLAGAVPHRGPGGQAPERPGRDARSMLREPRRGYLLFGIEPELDCGEPATASRALCRAQCVIAFTAFRSEAMAQYAHVLLPIAPYVETPGTFVNLEGRWQSFEAAVPPFGDARPGWKILRVMGNLLDLEGFDHLSAREVRSEVEGMTGDAVPGRGAWRRGSRVEWPRDSLCRLGNVPIYATDPVVRRARALQETRDAAYAGVALNARSAARLGLAAGAHATLCQGGARITAPVVVDERLPDGCAALPAGIPQSAALGPGIGPLRITPA